MLREDVVPARLLGLHRHPARAAVVAGNEGHNVVMAAQFKCTPSAGGLVSLPDFDVTLVSVVCCAAC